jgi:hypothetical protein
LRARGCRYGQGYFLAPPMPADAALRLLVAERDLALITPLGTDGVEPASPLGDGEIDSAAVTVH